MGSYKYSGAPQFVTVTQSGTFDIAAYGAQGGSSSASGGKGAEELGTVTLTKGEELEIIVGGAGTNSANYANISGGSGGGGTFVLAVNGNGSYTPLLVAGGGGGAREGYAGGSGTGSTTNGGGTTGGGGGTYGGGDFGGGGTGLKQDGATNPGTNGIAGGGGGFNRSGGYSGGTPGYNGYKGGFGGGGGSTQFGAGGGGGYAGGNGGDENGGAGGGGSFAASSVSGAGTNPGVQSGNGLVLIVPVSGQLAVNTTTTYALYDTSAGSGAGALTSDKAGNTFGFSFSTTTAGTLSSYKLALNNPGGGTGSISTYIYSNSANNTPGTAIAALATENDSSFAAGGTLASGTGNGVKLSANTTYWLVAVNSANSNLQLVADNSAPGIGYANQYLYDSSQSTTHSYSDASNPVDGQVLIQVCFASGTRIRTTRGGIVADVAVEHLRVGDLAVTASGEVRPIRWLGHRAVDCARHPQPEAVLPVRIAADAIASGVPARDLLVSPAHCLCLDLLGEVLVPAHRLCNGSTIRQEAVGTITYWHVELDSHDVLLAENAPAESYLECGNRAFFAEAEGAVALHAIPDAPIRSMADACRPFHDDGALVAAAQAQLARRAVALGWELADGDLADVRLVAADGRTIAPDVDALTLRFTIPAGIGDLRLQSSAVRPCDVGAGADARTLGLCLAGLELTIGGEKTTIPLNEARLGRGFHPVENGTHRWSNGSATLPAALWAGEGGMIGINLAVGLLPRWRARRGEPARVAA